MSLGRFLSLNWKGSGKPFLAVPSRIVGDYLNGTGGQRLISLFRPPTKKLKISGNWTEIALLGGSCLIRVFLSVVWYQCFFKPGSHRTTVKVSLSVIILTEQPF